MRQLFLKVDKSIAFTKENCSNGPWMQSQMENQKQCLRCGRCCLADFSAYVTDEDVRRWKSQNRLDILNLLKQEHGTWEGDHLVSSESGATLHGCPFFFFDQDQFGCAIHETRPETCRRYEPGSSALCPQFGKLRTRKNS